MSLIISLMTSYVEKTRHLSREQAISVSSNVWNSTSLSQYIYCLEALFALNL